MTHSIDINGVLEAYSALTGNETVDEQSALVCRGEAYTLCRLLRRDCDCIKEMPRLVYAAACNAYYRRMLLEAADEADSFKAGDVTVTKNEAALGAARELADRATAAISDLLVPRRFAFQGVSV